MKVVLVCPPTFYQIEHLTNKHMSERFKVNQEQASMQFKDLVDLYRNILGITVVEMPAAPGLSDMTFAANCGAVHQEIFIPSNFTNDHRKPEAKAAEIFMAGKLRMKIARLPEDVRFEGQGDLIRFGNRYFMGYGVQSKGLRTDRKAHVYLSKIVDLPVIPLELIDPWFYHLDTCMAVLSENTVMIQPSAFSPNAMAVLEEHFKLIIRVPDHDIPSLPCNLVRHDRILVMSNRLGPDSELLQVLRTMKYRLYHLNMDEFLKGGGSVKCLTLELGEYDLHHLRGE